MCSKIFFARVENTMSKVLSNSALTAAISGATVVAVSSFSKGSDEQIISMKSLKKAGYQAISSMLANSIEGMLQPYLPPGGKISSVYLKPGIVAGLYTAMAYFIDGDKVTLYQVAVSAGSEAIASYLEAPLAKMLMIEPNAPKMVSPAPGAPAGRGAGHSRSRVTG